MSKIAVICCKNPSYILHYNILNIKHNYPDFKIVIIDSDSKDIHVLEQIKKQFNDIDIELIKNQNYELGAWYYAFHKYNNYDIYMFIQDTLILTNKIENLEQDVLINDIVYSCHYTARIKDGGYLENLHDIYKNTKFNFITQIHPDQFIQGSAHTSFIAKRDIVKKVLELEDIYREKQLYKSKIESWLSERTLGIVLTSLNCNKCDMTPYTFKIHGNRN